MFVAEIDLIGAERLERGVAAATGGVAIRSGIHADRSAQFLKAGARNLLAVADTHQVAWCEFEDRIHRRQEIGEIIATRNESAVFAGRRRGGGVVRQQRISEQHRRTLVGIDDAQAKIAPEIQPAQYGGEINLAITGIGGFIDPEALIEREVERELIGRLARSEVVAER